MRSMSLGNARGGLRGTTVALTLAGAHTKTGDRLKNCVLDLGSVHSVLNVANGDLQLVLKWKHHTAITLHAIIAVG